MPHSSARPAGADSSLPAAETDAADLPPAPLLTTEDVARLLPVDPSSVRRWRAQRPPQGPPFVRLSGRVVLYVAGDVHNWLMQRRIDPGQVAA